MHKSIVKRDKMYTLVSSFEESGLTQTKFALQHGLNIHQFRYWFNKYSLETEEIRLSISNFIPIEVEPPAINSKEIGFKQINSNIIEIIMSNGTVVRIPII